MSFFGWALVGSLSLSLATLGIVVAYFFYFRKYTRERFAFRVFLLIGALSSSIVFTLLSGKSGLVLALSLVAAPLGYDASGLEPSFSDKMLILLILAGLIFLAVRLHRNWPGNISTREHDARLMGASPSIFAGTLVAIGDIAGKVYLEPYETAKRQSERSEFVSSPTETKAWHIWVARILHLSSHQFRIDELNDWFADRRVFISSYGSDDVIVAVFCCVEKPPESEINELIAFVTQQRGKPARVVVAIEQERGVRSVFETGAIEVEYRFRGEMLENLVDLTAYRDDIRFRYERKEIVEGYPFKIPDVYVAGSGFLVRGETNVSIRDAEEYLLGWVQEQSLKHMAVLGEYGQGKSVLALRLTYRLLFGRDSKRIPILVTLGGRSPRTQNKLQVLADWAAAYDINPKALLVLHEAGRLLLIFDGFDEMDLVGDARLRLDHFRSLWQFCAEPGAKILITGRPNFFPGQLERNRSLNIRKESIEVPFTEPLYLSSFDEPKIQLALRSFPDQVQTDIVTSLSSAGRESFADLMARPSTLFLAATIWEELRSKNPSYILSAEVIGKFIDHAYDRQEKKPIRSFLTRTEREYFTVGMAMSMRNATRYANHLSKEAFQRAIITLFEAFPNELSQFEDVASLNLAPLKERLQDRELLIETISTDVRSCGILVTDLSQIDAFKFAHKSFLEFLVASNLIYTNLDGVSERDMFLHHAARPGLPSERFRFLPLNAPFIPPGYDGEVGQFAGEILFALSGVSGEMTDRDVEEKLSRLGVPIRRLNQAASLGSKFYSRQDLLVRLIYGYPFMLSLTLAHSNPGILFAMAAFYSIRGRGGVEFINFKKARLDRRQQTGDDPISSIVG